MSEPLRLELSGNNIEGIDFGRMMKFFMRRMPIFILAAAFGGALGFGAQVVIPAKYTSSTEILLDPKRADAFGADATFSNIYVDSSKVASVVSVMQSSELLRRVVRQEKLSDDPTFGYPTTNVVRRLLAFLRFFAPAPARTDPEAREDRALEKLKQVVRVNRVGATYVLTVDVTSQSPQTSQKLADAVAEEYINDQVGTKVQAARKDNAWLESRLTELRQQLEASERAAEDVRAKFNLPDIGHRGDGVLDRQARVLRRSLGLGGPDDQAVVPGGGPTSAELSKELWKTRLDIALRRARCEQIQRTLNGHGSLDGLPEVSGSRVVEDLKLKQADLARRLSALKSIYSDNYPELKHARQDLSVVENRIASETSRAAQGVCEEYKLQMAKEQALAAEVAQATSVERSTEGVQGRVELLQAQRIVNTNQGLYDSLLERQREVEKQLIRHEAEARIISKAKLPQESSWPKPLILPAGGAALCFAMSVGGAMLLPKLKSRMTSPADVERSLAVPVIATVPRLRRRDLRINRRRLTIVHYIILRPLSRFAESLRTARVALQSGQANRSRSVQITSAAPGEGKSTIAVAISISAARAGLKTVLVDADTRRSRVVSMFDAAAKAVAPPKLPLHEQFELHRYDCGGYSVDVIDVGSEIAPQPDIIASPPFADLLSDLTTRYDLVIVDTPPILAVSDPLAIACLVDETFLVIDAQATRKDVVLEALKPVRAIGRRLTGAILNKAVDGEVYLQYARAVKSYYLEDTKARLEVQAIADRHQPSVR